ncbi:uncharacterized protein At1g28695-like [Rhododendron vialii]|uniref:uncharacterized protein At1g28695-like n=1 Tax=Rhododendron vialii TaxID=182163 RepID=UPI00265EADC2|nr:uncharacterized protein At1g28695-like [Rhododendron vialii]
MKKSSSTEGLPPCPESNHMTNMVKNRAFDFSILLLLFFGSLYFISIPSRLRPIFSTPNPPRNSSTTFEMIVQRDELDMVLAETSTENKTVIITMVNKAYVEGDKSMLDLFMESFWLGDGTWGLIDHLLIVAADQVSYERCKFLRLHCYKLETDGEDFAGEKVYMSKDFIKMMWRRTLFLGDVLKRGYNFIFTDTDVLWFRNPFSILSPNETIDFQISVDIFNGSEPDFINTGFYMIRSNNKTIALFDHWYAKKEVYFWTKEQDVLKALMRNGLFRDLALNVRFLDTLYFSGFCENSRNVGVVVTVHANCCRTIRAKVADLTIVIHDWRRAKGLFANETSTFRWSEHLACVHSWDN